MKKGIDVSKWQGDIDWAKVKADGVEFAMLRAGYGKGNIDEKFKRNISECNRLGIPCGVYWFSYAYTEDMAKKEAQYCLEAVKPYKLEYPIAFDFEYDSVNYAKKKGVTVTKTLATKLVKAFCGEIEKAGYFAMNYTNKDYLNKYFDADVPKLYATWLAQWPANPVLTNPPTGAAIWQYTSKGSVKGISGSVDMDAAYNDYPALIRRLGLNNLGKAENEVIEWAKSKGLTDGDNLTDTVTYNELMELLYKLHG